MKNILLVLVFIFSICSAFGQSIEWEILNMGYCFGLTKDNNGNTWNSINKKISGSLTIGSEMRINLLENRLSLGVQASLTGWNRYDPSGYPVEHQFALAYLAVCDYNFLKVHPKIMPFAGIGAGISQVSADESYIGYRTHFAFSPRIGVELFKHIRLATEYRYLGNRNNYFNIRLGFVIGS